MRRLLLLTLITTLPTIAFAKPIIRYRIIGVTSSSIRKNIETRLQIGETAETKQQAIKAIKLATEPYGYFKPSIHTRWTRKGRITYTNYYIKLGPPLHITKIHFELSGTGKLDPGFIKLSQHLPIKAGHIFTTADYEKTKNMLFDLALHRGYLGAKLKRSRILINLKKYQATIILEFNTGKRYYFGEVSFSKSHLYHHFLEKYIPFKYGQPYDNRLVQKLQQNLGDSNYFKTVIVTPHPQQARNLRVPIRVQLVPRKAKQYTLGLGYGTDTGIRGLAGIKWIRVTKSGHQLKAIVRAARRIQNFTASYIIPGPQPTTDRFQLSTKVENQRQNSGKSRSVNAAISFLTSRFGWQQTYALTYLNENSQLSGQNPINANLYIPSVNWLRLYTDNPLKPTRGYRINLSARAASLHVLSSLSFAQVRADGKAMIPLLPSNRLVVHGTIGYMSIKNVSLLPYSLQFFAGGAQSVRGYQYKQIGPGRVITVGSIEFQQHLIKQLYATAFYDVGNVSSNINNKYQRGAGVGILWESPVGALELTLARALDAPGKPWMVQFSMGPIL